MWQDQFLHVVSQNKVIDPSTLIPLQEGFLGPIHTYSCVTFYLSEEHLHISWHLQSQQNSSLYSPEHAVTLTDTDAADHSVLVQRVLTQKLTDDVPSKAEAYDHQQCEGVGSFDRVHHCRKLPGTTWIKEDVLSLRCFDVSSLSDVCDCVWWGSSLLCVWRPVANVTVGEQAWCGELQVRQSSQVVKYCAAVTLPLGVIHKGPNVFVLTMVTDSRADHHGNITWHTDIKMGVMIQRHNNIQLSFTTLFLFYICGFRIHFWSKNKVLVKCTERFTTFGSKCWPSDFCVKPFMILNAWM